MRQPARALSFLAALLLGGGSLFLAGRPLASPPPEPSSASPARPTLEWMTVRAADGAPLEAVRAALSERLACEVALTQEPAEGYDDALALRLCAGMGPDLFEVSEEWVGPYAARGWLLPLENALPAGVYDPLPQGARAAAQSLTQEGIFAVPAGVRTVRLVCNERLFARLGLTPPASFAQLVLCARAIWQAEGGNGVCGLAICGGDAWNGLLRPLESVLSAQGEPLAGMAEDGAIDDPYAPWRAAVAAMQRDGSLYAGSASLSLEEGSALFAAGGAGMLLTTSTGIAHLAAWPDCVSYRIALPPTPLGEVTATRELPRAGYFAVNASATDADLARRALALLLEEENLLRLEASGKLLRAQGGSALPKQALPTANEAPAPLAAWAPWRHVLPELIEDLSQG